MLQIFNILQIFLLYFEVYRKQKLTILKNSSKIKFEIEIHFQIEVKNLDNASYRTKQREYILSFFKDNAGKHFTAEDVFEHLKSQGNCVGKSTVYRYLEKLEKTNMVRKYIADDGASACFEYVDNNTHCDEHFHFKCSSCGALLHVDCDFLVNLNNHIMSHHNFEIDYSKTVLYGICSDCLQARHKGD